MSEASKIISSAIVGLDSITILVAGKTYFVSPPTIHRIAGAAMYLSDLDNGQSLKDVIGGINKMPNATKALSCFICGDTSKYEELAKGTFDEIVDALEKVYSMVSPQNFTKLSALAKSVATLTAKQK